MFTHKDIEFRSIFVINCFEKRAIRVSNGELLLEEVTEDQTKTLTKFPFQKILAIFIIGHITLTSPLIEKCKQFNIALIVMKTNLRPVFFWANHAEANFILHQKQYFYPKDNLTYAKLLITNKIKNQIQLLEYTRRKDPQTQQSKQTCQELLTQIANVQQYDQLLGLEGRASKAFFPIYFRDFQWQARRPRIKIDPLNATLDIGYTILFNYIEAFARIFGFDPYVGVYHRLWYQRKSLICDLMEPFRCLIDAQVRKSYNLKQFSPDDFRCSKNEYILKLDKYSHYNKIFYQCLIERKMDVFHFMQSYYRSFMRNDVTRFNTFNY